MHDIAFFRSRTNTDAKLQKIVDKKKVESNLVNIVYTSEPEKIDSDNNEFEKKPINEFTKHNVDSKFEENLLKQPPIELNRFHSFAKFDGSNQGNRSINVFVIPFPKEHRVYPLQVNVQPKATVGEFIGLILFNCYVQHPEVSRKIDFKDTNIENEYSIYIADETGELDTDLPPLDNSEQIQKFHFNHLALSRKIVQNFQSRSFSVASENNNIVANKSSFDRDILSNPESSKVSFLSSPTTSMAHSSNFTTATDAFVDTFVYQAFRVYLISKTVHFKTSLEVQLGISEKIEIDPVQKNQSKLFRQIKALHFSIDTVAWCEITSRKSNRFTFSIAHVPTTDPFSSETLSSFEDSVISSSLKVHTFETDPTTAEIIYRKVNRLLDAKSNSTSVLREHMARNEKSRKSFFKKKKFFN